MPRSDQAGREVIREDVFEDLGTFDPHSHDGYDDPSVFDDDTPIDDLPDVGEVDLDEEAVIDELEEDDPNG